MNLRKVDVRPRRRSVEVYHGKIQLSGKQIVKSGERAMTRWTSVLLCALSLLVATLSHAQQRADAGQGTQVAYPASDEGLQQQLQDLAAAAKSKDGAKQVTLVRSLIMPDDSTWFKDEFGPAFGPRLAAAYQRAETTLKDEIQTVYEGNAQRGWLRPRIFRYDDAAAADSPVDNWLNCMEKVAPLYRTAFDGNRTAYQMGRRPDDPSKYRIISGDLPGYYVHAGGAFRFIPQEVLFLLPRVRPIRIQLNWDIMKSKLTSGSPPLDSLETMQRLMQEHKPVYGKVVIHFVLDTNGKIKELSTVEGSPELSEPFLQAARQWRFEPTTLDSEPAEVEFDMQTGRQRNGKWE